ncbi:phosphatidylinositol 4-phosphate 3-kinase C2 domain-containing subunit alpha-like [Watersipora subatra]|uniref:phosphatidylinositol 4-phosphate 3-kinase C2 domain-containing subunit alpha-like n=1 Tax=Watersipora subatra TaxID=2589382 RepID=UPI00355C1A2A
MDELTAFSVMVARLKSDYKHDDKYTNLGILFSPTVNISTPDGLTVEVTIYTEMASQPIHFRTEVTTSIEILIWNVMSNISGNFLEVSVDDYILKVFNCSEYLVNDSNLSDYVYTHNCLKLKQPIKFSLHKVAVLDKPFLRKPGDDEEPIYMIKDELHGDKSYKVNPEGLRVLHEIFTNQSESLNNDAIEKGLQNICLSSLLQSVKAITTFLLGAETLEIKLAMKQMKKTLSEADGISCADGRFIELNEQFQANMESLTTGIRNLLIMYCETFRVRYTHLDFLHKRKETIDVNDYHENIIIYVGSVHRIPAKTIEKFDKYKVVVSLYYAGVKVCEPTSTKIDSSLNEENLRGNIYFGELLQIENFPVSKVPAEARILFTLCAMNTCQPVQSGGSNARNKWVAIEWVSFMFFDFRRNVTQGNKLLSLWHGEPDISGATGSNIWQSNTVILHINMEFAYNIQFPPPLPQTPKFIEKDGEDVELPAGDLAELTSILAKEDGAMTKEDKRFMWSKRETLSGVSEALPKVLLSAPLFGSEGTRAIQDVLNCWTPLSTLEALRLLLPDFPCQQIRNYAVKCLKTVSSDEMCDYLPQLVQAMKFENYHDSELVRLLLERCITSIKLAQQLFWSLKEVAAQPAYRERYKLLFGGLVSVIGKSLREEMEREETLVHHCHSVAEKVKQARGDDKVMSKAVLSICDLLSTMTLRLPTNPCFEVNGLDTKLCTSFNSNTFPLKLAFKTVDHSAPNHSLMYKIGDDLRQDMIVMQLINIMDKLWQQNDLDLKLVTFVCLPTGDKRGMVELITECETLAKIQGFSGITGSFKDQPLANWLQKHNPSQAEYQKAVENFTLSCAGYCVATYILGIGDRHNDNIMVKRSGHIFHIDFSKFLGDCEKFLGLNRDRTPFILTKDMVYVINGSDKQGQNFQDFVDLCCEAFNIIREQADGLLTLLELMTSSGIMGLTSEAVQYVKTALLLEQTNSEATVSFTRMIEVSLKSRFVQLNFFVHNWRQRKSSRRDKEKLLSFIPSSYSMATDGRIINVEIFDYQKRSQPEKHYIYIIKVHRQNRKDPTLVLRRYSEFQEFYGKLVDLFPLANVPRLPGRVVLGRTHVQKVAEKRKVELEIFLRELLMLAKEISEHDLLYTFFHPMLRDEAEPVVAEATAFTDNALRPNIKNIKGEVLLSMQYKWNALHILVKHARDVGNESGDRPNPYVKMYLLPDPTKTSKRKTKVSRSTFHPVYNEMFEYRLPMREVRERTLQVTVWSAELTGNEFLGAVHISLYEADLSKEGLEWHKLSTLLCIKT